MSMQDHINAMLGNRFGPLDYTPYAPLGASEFRTLTTSGFLTGMADETLERLWLIPVQRMLQTRFSIDQRNYTASTRPTLAELEEDFKVAAALMVEKLAAQGDVLGSFSDGGRSGTADQNVPPRASALLDRYKSSAGRLERS